jgi:hypothetical protein
MSNTDEDDEFDRILRENRIKAQPYYFPPQPKWTGLTDSEIGTIAYNVNPLDGIRQFARAIEAKLKEKNT